MLSVEAAASRLGVSERRVRALIAAGRLPAERVGRSWVIDLAALGRVDGVRPVGRPLGMVAAWGELLGDVPAPAFDVGRVRARYRRRSGVEVFDAPDVASAVSDPVLVAGGWDAAVRWDPLLENDDVRFVRYVAESALAVWCERQWAVRSASGPIVVRSVPDHIAERLACGGERVVPARVAAVDLAEGVGPRLHEAAQRLWVR